MSADEPQTRTLHSGDKLGHFRITEQVGAGGTAIVYRAHDDLLSRDVAIKQVRLAGEPDDDELRYRIKREAQHQQKASNADPNRLVQLIDVIDDSRGLFIVSEYVEGVSLEQDLAQNTGPMPLKRAVGILAATAQALEVIHQQQIIHRDLKPANILMPAAGGLKIADFGLASAMSEQQLMSIGSVRYMAPELLRGEDADGRADLYSLGMITYEMLVGRTQFEQAFRMVLRDQRNQAMRWVKWHTNPRAKVTPVKQMRDDVPDAIAELVDRLMEKDAARRVPSAGEVVEAIRRHYAGESPAPAAGAASAAGAGAGATGHGDSADGETTGGGDTAELPRRSRVPMILACILGFWVLVAGGAGTYYYIQQSAAAAARRNDARDELDTAYAAMTNNRFDEAMTTARQVEANWAPDSDIGRTARAYGMFARAKQHLANSEYEQAAQQFEALDDEINLYRVDRLSPDNVQALERQARNSARFEQAVAQLERHIDNRAFAEANRVRRDWLGPGAPDLTPAEETRLNELSDHLRKIQTEYERNQVLEEVDNLLDQENRQEAIDYLQREIARLRDVHLLQERLNRLTQLRDYKEALATARDEAAEGNHQAAIDAYNQALAIRENQQIDDEGSVRVELNQVKSEVQLAQGRRLLEEGELREAEAAFNRSLQFHASAEAREALEAVQAQYRRDDYVQQGDEAFAAGDYPAALQAYQQAVAIASSDRLQEKVEQARRRHLIETARQAIRDDDLNRAAQMLDQASQLAGDGDALSDARNLLETHRTYHKHLARGDAARDRADYGTAKQEYRAAQNALNTEIVRQRLFDAEYADAVARAQDALANHKLDEAESWISVAEKMRDTEQVEDLREQLESARRSAS